MLDMWINRVYLDRDVLDVIFCWYIYYYIISEKWIIMKLWKILIVVGCCVKIFIINIYINLFL